jgi:hypothetical protein
MVRVGVRIRVMVKVKVIRVRRGDERREEMREERR